MKRSQTTLYTAAIVALMLLFSACGSVGGGGAGTPDISTVYSTKQIAEILIGGMVDIPPLLPLSMGDSHFSDYLSDIYALDGADLDDAVIFYAHGAYATEVAVLRFVDAAAANGAKDALDRYIIQRERLFAGYAPDQALILKNSRSISHGPYAALLICPDPTAAAAMFMACFSDNPPPWSSALGAQRVEDDAVDADTRDGYGGGGSDTLGGDALGDDTLGDDALVDDALGGDVLEDGTLGDDVLGGEADTASGLDAGTADANDDSETDAIESTVDVGADAVGAETIVPPPRYDHAGILAAWNSGDASALSEKNRKILDFCRGIIDELIRDGMDDYEKELAIHDWIIDWAEYDREALSNAPDAKPNPDHDNPYGLLLHKVAICSGYTTTFQLFMDMLGIECITVHGGSDGEEHAWNMVRIDGQWYCVDVTWNDPIGSRQSAELRHRYFNVSSEFMRNNRHQWDESTTPVADAPKLYRP